MLVTIIIASKNKYKIRDIKKLVSLFLYHENEIEF